MLVVVATAIIFATTFFVWVAMATTVCMFVLMCVVTTAAVFATALVCVVMVAALIFATTLIMVMCVYGAVCVSMFVIMIGHNSISFKNSQKLCSHLTEPLWALCIKNNSFANNMLLTSIDVIIS